MNIRRYIFDLVRGAERSWQYSKERSVLYGVLAVALMPTAFLVERSVTEPAFDTAVFRLFPTLVAVPLLFYRALPQFSRVLFPFYWALALMIVFPFNYTTVLIQNAARSAGELHPIWLWEFLFSLFVLVQFTSHTKLCVFLFSTGAIFGVLSLIWVENPNWDSIYENVVLIIPVILTTFVILLVSNRHLFKAQEEKLLALRYLGSNIAHELRTPLATIRNLSTGTNKLLPILVEVYRKKSTTDAIKTELRDSQLDALDSALTTIRDEVDHSNAIIDVLVLNTLDRPIISLVIDEVPAAEVLQFCLDEFPFNNQLERSLAVLEVRQDFVAFAPVVLFKHIVFNLLKNAVRHVQKVSAPSIRIIVDGANHSISVINNGPEISRSQKKNIFQQFYTTVPIGEGNGIGLSFCKLAMESFDGKISVESSRRKGTCFKLSFAKKKPKLLPRIADVPELYW